MKNKPAHTKARVNYLRVSDEDGQYPERSFSSQRNTIEERLSPLINLPLSHEYADIERGTRNDRFEYQKMLKDAKAGLFSDICVYRIDRFGRSPREIFHAVDLLQSLGVRIWVADAPSMEIGTPNGNLQLGIQAVLSKYEIDVLGQRVSDIKRDQMLQGKWPTRSREGYVNKREEISGRKYRCWVEPDPVQGRMVRKAYDLWLSGHYTLQQVAEELHKLGYTRKSGKPWVWIEPNTDRRRYALSDIQRVLSSPFYAGWVISETHDISRGMVRGEWSPLVTDGELDRSLEILREHDGNKARVKKHTYTLQGVLWLKYCQKDYKTHGSTPTGRSRSYSYYETVAKCDGKNRRIAKGIVESNFAEWILNIGISSTKLPEIRRLYNQHVHELNGVSHKLKLDELQSRIHVLESQEKDLVRLLLSGKIGDEAYGSLRREWEEKLSLARREFNSLNRDAASCLDDLEVALKLLSQVGTLFKRLPPKQQSLLVRILVKKIVVNTRGEIVSWKLNSPFEYLSNLACDERAGNHLQGGPTSTPSKTIAGVVQFSSVASFPQRTKLQSLHDGLESFGSE